MSLASLNFLLKTDITQFKRGLNEAQGNLSGFAKGVKALGGLIGGALTVDALLDFGKASVQAFDQSEKASAELLTSLNGNTDALRRLSSQATSLQSKKLFDDESIKGAQMFLATMKLSEAQISKLIPLVMDFAVKYQMDLLSAANLVSKAIGSSTNALGRYGISVEGAAGSTERFDGIVAGLTKQVGGLSDAASEAGTSSLVQLRNTIGEIQEMIGKVIWADSGFSNFIRNLKELLELKSGKMFEIAASDAETFGRQMVSNAKSLDEGKAALEGYLKKLKEQIKAEAEAASVQQREADKRRFSGILSTPYQDAADKHTAKVQGMTSAYFKLEQLMGDFPAIMSLFEQGHKKINPILDDETKKVETLTQKYERLNAAYLATLPTGPEPAAGFGMMQGRDMSLTVGGDKKLAGSIITPEMLNNLDLAAQKQAIVNAEFEKSETLMEMLGYHMESLGRSLSDGAETWADFGKSALNALRQVVAGLIAEGIATAIVNTLKATGITGPAAVGFAGLAGGAAAGIFSTLVPKLAGGGLAYSPQLAVVGDNRNASIDPEVIAPLSKLQGMMSVNVVGRSVTRGRDIYTIWEREDNFRGRTGGIR